ncbi:MAG TPA: bifunctional phosphoglucose/phosphomannose isomerase [Dehalococcoidia bacterium]|nr:bifunctional phosphoglucose/phosphomannose isomerase [Dehalococcoidia bacterium]
MNDINLDDPQVYNQYDPEGMLERIHEMPELCQRAWQMAMNFNFPQGYSRVNKVVISGMGGSAIGSDLVNSLVASEAKLPILIYRDYELPAFIDGQTLVIASSYSGMTDETLFSFEQALETESKKLVITTGGKLKTLAEERNIPVFSFDYEAQPRAALPFNFLSILGFLQTLGFIRDKSVDVREMVRILQELSQKINEGVPVSHNPAKQLANRLYGHLPVIYGAGILSEVAHRWKTQLNENSKAWAFYEVFPELNHNAVVGYQYPPELASKMVVVLLRSALLPQRIQLCYQVTCQLLERAKINYQFVDGEGTSPLSQMMSLVLFGDYISYYMAILYKTDPTPIKAIDYLKEQLAQGGDKEAKG